MTSLSEKVKEGLHALPRRDLTILSEDTLSWQVRCANAGCDHFLNVAKRVGVLNDAGETVWRDVTVEESYPCWCPPCGFAVLRVAQGLES
jgi:hypothetical protein